VDSDLQDPPKRLGTSLSAQPFAGNPNPCVYALFMNLLRDFYVFSQVIVINPENATEAEWPLGWNA
jgi:hypothetical protein